MARLWSCGFELQTITVGMEWRTNTNNSPGIETTIVRSGAAAVRFNGTATLENFIHIVASAQGVRYYRAYIYLVAAPSIDGLKFYTVNNASNEKIGFRVNSNRTLEFHNEEDFTQIGSDSSAISLDTWYRLELKIDSTTLASTAVEARLYAASDETTLLWNPSATVDLAADPNRWRIGQSVSNSTFDMVMDDLAVNDNSGSFQNSWCGEGSLIILRPNAAGDSAQWTRGGTDSGANWSQTEEVTPDDVTTYVESNTSGQIDQYNLEATPSAIESDSVINWVGVGSRFAISNATGADPDFVVGLKASGGTVDKTGNLSGSGATTYTSMQTTLGNYPALSNDSNYQLPGTANAWTKSDLDSAQVHLEETATDTHFIRVSALWVYVDYSPPEAGGTEYTQSVSGGITPSGVVLKLTSKTFSGGITPTGAVNKLSTKTFSGGITPSGSLLKQAQKILSGALSSIVGTLSTNRGYTRSFDGDITPTGAIAKETQKPLSGQVTSSGSIVKSALKFLGSILSPVGTLVKETKKVLSGNITPSGILETARIILKDLAGTLGLSGVITKLTSKTFSGGFTPSGTIAKQTNKAFAGEITLEGGFEKVPNKSLAGNVTPTGTVNKQSSKSLAGNLTPAGSLLKSITKIFYGTLTLAGTLTKQTNKFLTGVLTLAGDLVGELISGGQEFFKDLAGTLGLSGTVNKSTTKTFSGTLDLSGILNKLTNKFFSGTLTSSGSLTASGVFLKALEGAMSFIGTLTKRPNKNLSGSLPTSGTLSKGSTKSFSGNVTPSGTVNKSTLKTLSGVLTSSGVLQVISLFVMVLSGEITFSGAVSKMTGKSLQGTLTSGGVISKAVSKFVSGVLTFTGTLTRILNAIAAEISKVILAGSYIVDVSLQGIYRQAARLSGVYRNIIELLGNIKGRD